MDIRDVTTDSLPKPDSNASLVVIGGPPCQAYSLVGRAKLRSLGKGREHTKDHRGYLFEDFVRIISDLSPDAVVMENVPESMDYGGMNVPMHVSSLLSSLGYQAKWTILNAADYGVPQSRERVFVVATKKSHPGEFTFPAATHMCPRGVATQLERRISGFQEQEYFVLPPDPVSNPTPWVTVGEAISDLPSLFPKATSKYRLFKPTVRLSYSSEVQNEYQSLMREWYGQPSTGVTGNCFRRTMRDFQIFERMQEGDDFVAASLIADSLLDEVANARGLDRFEDCDEYTGLKKKIVPPYDRTKFLSKWKKLIRDKPSHTITAHLGVDSYSHIHPWEPRGISVREAARLQSFPDEFLFLGTMSDAFRHIGNAVPPLLARAIADKLFELFQSSESTGKGVGVDVRAN